MASINDDLATEVKKIITDDNWETVDAQSIPDSDGLKLGNHGKRLDATILYADLADSTNLVDTETDTFAAEIYKSYIACCVKIIRNNDGEIASFDGDRVMGIFHGKSKNTSAVRSALQINGAVHKIINPRLKIQYPSKNYKVVAASGVDTSKVLVALCGRRNNNDLVWIGKAANHAAKLCGLRQDGYSTWISKEVYENMSDTVKLTQGTKMWEAKTWTKYNRTVYRSNYMMVP